MPLLNSEALSKLRSVMVRWLKQGLVFTLFWAGAAQAQECPEKLRVVRLDGTVSCLSQVPMANTARYDGLRSSVEVTHD